MKSTDVCDMKVTDEDGFLAIMKERIWIDCVASEMAFLPLNSDTSHPGNLLFTCFGDVSRGGHSREKLRTRCSLLLGCVSMQVPSKTLTKMH